MSRESLNLTGERFGRLVVIKEAKRRGYHRYWLCKCDCGNEKEVYMSNLRYGKTQSCGCLHTETVSKPEITDLTGKRFGSLIVIKVTEKNPKSKMPRWLCKCDCGSDTIAYSSNLMRGHSRSCGCEQGGKSALRWTEDEELSIINLLNTKKNTVEISQITGRTINAVNRKIAQLKNEKKLKKCADCENYFIPKSVAAKFCSDQCRWRNHKKKTTKKRRKEGLCPQCGGVMDVAISTQKSKVTTTYCTKCQEYFHDNYLKNKIEKE